MAANPWDAERVVDADRAAALIAEQFPELGFSSVTPLGVGWDNTVHLLDGRWVFRFPRRAVALPGVGREIAVLPWLAGTLPVAIPVPTYVGTDQGWPFWGGPLVPGQELVGLPEPSRVDVGATAGRFLRVLHATAVPAHLRATLPVDPLRRAEPAVRADRVQATLGRVDPDRARAATALLRAAATLGPSSASPVLVHGDLHVRHVLVEGAVLSGVIDWGDLCLADPAVDLSIAYAGFAGASRQALLTAYGPVSEETELRARALGLSLCALLADSAQDSGRPGLRDEVLRGVQRCVS